MPAHTTQQTTNNMVNTRTAAAVQQAQRDEHWRAVRARAEERRAAFAAQRAAGDYTPFLLPAVKPLRNPAALLDAASSIGRVEVLHREVEPYYGGSITYHVQRRSWCVRTVRRFERGGKLTVSRGLYTPLSAFAPTPKMVCELVPSVCKLSLEKTQQLEDCGILVTRSHTSKQLAGERSTDVWLSLPAVVEQQAVQSGASVTVKNEHGIVVRVKRTPALTKALRQFFDCTSVHSTEMPSSILVHIQQFVGEEAVGYCDFKYNSDDEELYIR